MSQGMQRQMHVGYMTIKRGRGESVHRGREEKKGNEGKKKRGRKGNRRSEGRNSSDQKVKFVYSTRATLQEVGILPTLDYFPP